MNGRELAERVLLCSWHEKKNEHRIKYFSYPSNIPSRTEMFSFFFIQTFSSCTLHSLFTCKYLPLKLSQLLAETAWVPYLTPVGRSDQQKFQHELHARQIEILAFHHFSFALLQVVGWRSMPTILALLAAPRLAELLIIHRLHLPSAWIYLRKGAKREEEDKNGKH